MASKERPYILFVAELIYSEISKIKKNNLDFSNIDAIDSFIGSQIYKKVKDFCIKYWKALVALALLLIGYFIGRRGETSKIIKVDSAAKEKALEQQLEDVKNLHNEHTKKRDELFDNKEKQIKDIEKTRKDNIENLSNNEEKLDKILKDRHGLKKGE